MTKSIVVTKHFPQPLTDARKEELQEELVENTNKYNHLEEVKKRIAEEQTKVMKVCRKKADIAAEILALNTEMQGVECQVSFLFETNTVQTRRLDTKAVIEERAMTVEEHAELKKG